MSPASIIERLKEEATFTEDESAAFHDLRDTVPYAYANSALTRMLLVCGDMALEDGRTEYWSGVKEGVGMFFEMTEGEAKVAYELQKTANYEEDEEEGQEEPDLSQAISALGTSPL